VRKVRSALTVKIVAAVDATADVADDPTQAGAQELELASRPLELNADPADWRG